MFPDQGVTHDHLSSRRTNPPLSYGDGPQRLGVAIAISESACIANVPHPEMVICGRDSPHPYPHGQRRDII
jgi:hypothetical protein